LSPTPSSPMPTDTLLTRVLSFGRKSRPQETQKVQTKVNRVLSFGRKRTASVNTVGGGGFNRRASITGRRASIPGARRSSSTVGARRSSTILAQARDVSVYKPSKDTPIGLALNVDHCAVAATKGALIVKVAADSPAAKCGRFQPGDIIRAVNGVAATDVKHASALLRAAEGVVQLVILPATALPDGWAVQVDRSGEQFYTHEGLKLKSYAHPACINLEAQVAPESPPKRARAARAAGPLQRWHMAFHTVSVVNRFNGDVERIEKRRSRRGMENTHMGGNILQHERV